MSTPTRLDVPAAAPAASDLVCWLHAAYPLTPRRTLPTTRIAADLGVSPSTLRRWITNPDQDRHTPAHRSYLARRAILRGKGTYLWPLVDAAAARRLDRSLAHATHCLTLVDDPASIPTSWHTKRWLTPHTVLLIHYPRAHVYGVAYTNHRKHLARLSRNGEIIQTHTAPNRWAALANKLATLQAHRPEHCTTPQALVPTGHTETWRATPTDPVPAITERITLQ